ncbi:GA-like domain-containing protein [Streptococcus ictaluri]|uniref:Uncharacterized protein n=1 Tax=Streptococcus ictaluri 707-05 TaxID=764299 RepID=G5K4A3_9STRE|nr:hypothetical protein [Streptococcus ictaluri]EHI68911.1 hypothetical protein STRIC_1623 [Streptococcus ictaluri 707-05]
MEKSKKETLFLLLSILTLTLAGGVYLIFGNAPKLSTVAANPSQLAKQLTKIQALLDQADIDPNPDLLLKIQNAINSLKKSEDKEPLQARLDAIKANLNQEQVALTAIELAEATLNQDLKDQAQKAINAVSREAQKAAMQARLDAVIVQVPVSENKSSSQNHEGSLPIEDSYDKTPSRPIPEPSSPQPQPQPPVDNPDRTPIPEPSQPIPETPDSSSPQPPASKPSLPDKLFDEDF